MKIDMNDNKLIAEFMGVEKTYNPSTEKVLSYAVNDDVQCLPHELQYHTSWDWLMPVVETCYHNGADGDEIGDITHGLLDCDMDQTYKAVVKFINEYNKTI